MAFFEASCEAMSSKLGGRCRGTKRYSLAIRASTHSLHQAESVIFLDREVVLGMISGSMFLAAGLRA